MSKNGEKPRKKLSFRDPEVESVIQVFKRRFSRKSGKKDNGQSKNRHVETFGTLPNPKATHTLEPYPEEQRNQPPYFTPIRPSTSSSPYHYCTLPRYYSSKSFSDDTSSNCCMDSSSDISSESLACSYTCRHHQQHQSPIRHAEFAREEYSNCNTESGNWRRAVTPAVIAYATDDIDEEAEEDDKAEPTSDPSPSLSTLSPTFCPTRRGSYFEISPRRHSLITPISHEELLAKAQEADIPEEESIEEAEMAPDVSHAAPKLDSPITIEIQQEGNELADLDANVEEFLDYPIDEEMQIQLEELINEGVLNSSLENVSLQSQAMRIVRTVGQAFEVCHKLSQQQPQATPAAATEGDCADNASDRSSDAVSEKNRKASDPNSCDTQTEDILHENNNSCSNQDVPPPAQPSPQPLTNNGSQSQIQPQRPTNLEPIPPPPEDENSKSASLMSAETYTSPVGFPLPVSSAEDVLPSAGTPLSSHHQIQLLNEQLEQQIQQTQVAIAQVQLLRDQLAAETTARLEAQARNHQLLVQNRDLLDHMQALVLHMKDMEMKLGIRHAENVLNLVQQSQPPILCDGTTPAPGPVHLPDFQEVELVQHVNNRLAEQSVVENRAVQDGHRSGGGSCSDDKTSPLPQILTNMKTIVTPGVSPSQTSQHQSFPNNPKRLPVDTTIVNNQQNPWVSPPQPHSSYGVVSTPKPYSSPAILSNAPKQDMPVGLINGNGIPMAGVSPNRLKTSPDSPKNVFLDSSLSSASESLSSPALRGDTSEFNFSQISPLSGPYSQSAERRVLNALFSASSSPKIEPNGRTPSAISNTASAPVTLNGISSSALSNSTPMPRLNPPPQRKRNTQRTLITPTTSSEQRPGDSSTTGTPQKTSIDPMKQPPGNILSTRSVEKSPPQGSVKKMSSGLGTLGLNIGGGRYVSREATTAGNKYSYPISNNDYSRLNMLSRRQPSATLPEDLSALSLGPNKAHTSSLPNGPTSGKSGISSPPRSAPASSSQYQYPTSTAQSSTLGLSPPTVSTGSTNVYADDINLERLSRFQRLAWARHTAGK